jgi:hypothetical protein
MTACPEQCSCRGYPFHESDCLVVTAAQERFDTTTAKRGKRAKRRSHAKHCSIATHVVAFTPKGAALMLPIDATPIDFAYAIDEALGNRTVGARINGRLVPLECVVDDGDVVEVFTSKAETACPSLDWLTFVKTPAARSAIRRAGRGPEPRPAALETQPNATATELIHPVPAARRFADVVVQLLPADSRARYEEEFRSELYGLAASGCSRRAQMMYTARLLSRVWEMRGELREPARRNASP